MIGERLLGTEPGCYPRAHEFVAKVLPWRHRGIPFRRLGQIVAEGYAAIPLCH
jgi:hypothetical protein